MAWHERMSVMKCSDLLRDRELKSAARPLPRGSPMKALLGN